MRFCRFLAVSRFASCIVLLLAVNPCLKNIGSKGLTTSAGLGSYIVVPLERGKGCLAAASAAVKLGLDR